MFIIDVGANQGEFSIEAAKRNSNCKIIAIEPIKELCKRIKQAQDDFELKNVEIIRCAIDKNERIASFNVSTHTDWGISSLFEFDSSKLKDEYWSTRSDMYFDTKEEVPVRRLSSICKDLGVSSKRRISFIKIDAQGLDLEVLISADKFINFIDFGMLEISISLDLGLYEQEENDLRIVLDWLDNHGFEGYYLKPNDPASNEFNLYFKRKGLDHNLMEDELSLRNLPMYDGKFFWHFPSSTLLNIEDEYHNIQNNLSEKKAQLKELTFQKEELEKVVIAQQDCLNDIEKEIRVSLPWLQNSSELLSWLRRSRILRLLRFLSK